MNWHTSTDDERIAFIIQRRDAGANWHAIRKELHICHTSLHEYRARLPERYQVRQKQAPVFDFANATDDERIDYITERRRSKASWKTIYRECGVDKRRVNPYRDRMPRELQGKLTRWDSGGNNGHCPTCGWLVDEPGECELCRLQRQGQVVLYHRLEAMHG